jgi:hypothetical protein
MHRWTEVNKDKLNAQRIQFRNKNPQQYMLYSARSRAKKKGWKCDIELEDIVIPDVCPVLGLPLMLPTGKGRGPNSPSIDRINNSLGYIKGNIQIISWRANNLKSDATVEELEKLLAFMKNGKT